MPRLSTDKIKYRPNNVRYMDVEYIRNSDGDDIIKVGDVWYCPGNNDTVTIQRLRVRSGIPGAQVGVSEFMEYKLEWFLSNYIQQGH